MAASLPIRDDLPSGYFVDEGPQGILALHTDVARTFHEAGYGPESDGSIEPGDLSGRQPLLALDTEDERFVVRRFSHGGLLRWLTGARYSDPGRPFRELVLSASLRQAGIQTPQVVGARARMAPGWGWYIDLVTRRLEDATDLGFLLAQARAGELSGPRWRRLVGATGQLVRRLHRHGCRHADLTPTNIVLQKSADPEAEPSLWIIDLDQSDLFANLSKAERLGNLRRLHRHVARRDARLGTSLTGTDLMRFLVGYEKDRSMRHAIWRDVATAHRRRSLFHGLGWLAEAWFGKHEDPRDEVPRSQPLAAAQQGVNHSKEQPHE